MTSTLSLHEVIRPEWPDLPPTVGAVSTTRLGGVSHSPYDDGLGKGGGGLNLGLHVGDDPLAVAENRKRLATLLPSEPVWLDQVHGTTVVDAAEARGLPQADASFSTEPGLVCAIMTADCLPVLLCDRQGAVVGAAHAGWRGLAAGVLENTVAAMRAVGDAHISAWLGPAIGPHRFEVGKDVREAFADLDPEADAAFRAKDGPSGQSGKFLADLYQLARIKLAREGVTQVYGGGRCTHDEAMFYSYRRDRTTGRMASLIWICNA